MAKKPKNGKQPNILVIWGDDIGISNLSCYSHRLMGYQTPNIDRLAREGMMFTDSYGEQSCTAGRSPFITGQSVLRTGLGKKGADGSTTIQFGGCDGKVPNCIPIVNGWNYTVRLYRPRAEILSGKWKFPEAQPAG